METVLTLRVNERQAHIFNFIYLIAKHYLYAKRCGEQNPNNVEFNYKIEKLKKYELYIAKTKGNLIKHYNKWCIKTENGTNNASGIDKFIIDHISNT